MCSWNCDVELKDRGDCAGLEDIRTAKGVLDRGIPIRKKKAENILIADSNL